MGILDWFLNKEKTFLSQLPDRIWLSSDGMKARFAEALSDPPSDKSLTLVVAHFPSTFETARASLHGRVDFSEVNQPDDWAAASRPSPERPVPVVLIRAPVLLRIGLPTLHPDVGSLRIFVFGRHFLREKDDAIAAFAERFAKTGQIGFHLSLDDQILRIFVNDSMLKFLRQSAGSEPWIESAMVSKSVQKAQEQIRADKIVAQSDADSPEEWLAKNSFPRG
jgi:hypothetical protein